ncbi:MAG: SurA N-terminal domain-containing protein [Burkholderiales bacterium]
MFDSVRKHQRLLQFVLLILILPAFMFFGISGYEGMLSGDRGIAKVGDAEIFQNEFDAAQRQQIEQMRQMLGDSIDAKLFDTPEARSRILEQLIAQKTIATRAAESRVIVTDQRVQQTILGIEGLKKPDGSFDRARYESLVTARGQTTAGFEAMVRADLQLQALPDAVQASAFTPKSVRERLVSLQEEKRELRELRFPALDFAAKVQPTDEQLTAYYEANAKAFETAESAKVEFVVLSRDAIAAQIAVSPDDLKTYYEQNKSRYGTAEERRASHILVKAGSDAKAKAEKLLAAVKADPSKFEAIAKASSDDPGSAAQGGDLGFFERGMMVKPFADAAFEMKEGEIRGPVESEFGMHIIRLTAVKAATIKPFEAVRAELEREVRLQQAGTKFAEAAQQFTDTVYEQSDSLKPAADKFKLEVRTGELLGRGPAPDAPKDSPLSNARLVSALFGDDVLRNKRNTEAVEIGPGRLAAARIAEYRAPQRRPFAEVKDDVRKRVIADESAKLAKAAGEARLAELKAGKGGDAGFGPARTVSRGAPGGLAPQALDAAYRLAPEPAPALVGVDLGGGAGYVIVQLLKVVPPSAQELSAKLAAYDMQLERAAAQQDVVDYLEALKGRTKIVRHPERIGAKPQQP